MDKGILPTTSLVRLKPTSEKGRSIIQNWGDRGTIYIWDDNNFAVELLSVKSDTRKQVIVNRYFDADFVIMPNH